MNDDIYKIRHEKLSNIWRYKWYETPVYYRTNVSTHIQRMKIIWEEVCNILKELWIDIDTSYVLDLIEVHDDEEIITDDIAAPIKEKFSSSEREIYESNQQKAREKLEDSFKSLFAETGKYEKLLNEEHQWGTLAYKILKFVDKLEANMEVSHEIFWGNLEVLSFHNPITNITINGFKFSHERAIKTLEDLLESIKVSRKSIEKYGIFNVLQIDWLQRIQTYTFHTENSLQQNFPYLPYERRKNLLLENLPEGEKKKLWEKSPFPILK